MRLRWSASAREDLKEIGRYIARDDPRAGRRWTLHLRRRARQAGDMPHSGRVVPEFGRDDIREILEGNYRIVYLIGPSSVEILAVREGHRRLVVE